MKTRVIYYSRTGHTQQIAEDIAKACTAEIEQIHEANNHKGALGCLGAACAAMLNQSGHIKHVTLYKR